MSGYVTRWADFWADNLYHNGCRDVGSSMIFFVALRPRHWAKNLLVFLAPFGAGAVSFSNAVVLLFAFLALSAAASATYLLNDVRDRDIDRFHPSKKSRAVAAGHIQPRTALIAALFLISLAVALGSLTNWASLAGIAVYLLIANLYSLWFKRVPALDVVILASLFVLRIVIGAAVVSVTISNWLYAAGFFAFLSIGFAKRFIELSLRDQRTVEEVSRGRGYFPADLASLQIAGLGSGLISALVLTQYIEKTQILAGGGFGNILWILVPIWVYWVTRFWIFVSRGKIPDDPVEFVLKDGVSYLVVFSMFLINAVVVWG